MKQFSPAGMTQKGFFGGPGWPQGGGVAGSGRQGWANAAGDANAGFFGNPAGAPQGGGAFNGGNNPDGPDQGGGGGGGGVTWTAATTPISGNISGINIYNLAGSTRTLAYISRFGPNAHVIAQTFDDGQTWTTLQTATVAGGAPGVVVALPGTGAHPLQTARILYGYPRAAPPPIDQVFQSADGGATFAFVDTGFSGLATPSTTQQMVVNTPNVVAFAQSGAATSVSTDRGATWTTHAIAGLSKWFGPYAALWDGTQYVALGANSGGAVVVGTSTDGASWSFSTPFPGPPSGPNIFIASPLIFDGTHYFIGTANGYLRATTPNGLATASEQTISFISGTSAMGSDGVRVFIFDGNSNVGSSTDSGATWTQETLAMAALGDFVQAMAYDAINGINIAIGLSAASINVRPQ